MTFKTTFGLLVFFIYTQALCVRPWPKRHNIDTYSTTVCIIDKEDDDRVVAHKTFEAPSKRLIADKVEQFVSTRCQEKENVEIILTCKVKTFEGEWIERNFTKSFIWCQNNSDIPLTERQHKIKTRKCQKKLRVLVQDMFMRRTLFDLGPVFTTFAVIIGVPLLALTAGIVIFAAAFTSIALTPVLAPVVWVGVPVFVVYEVGTSPWIYEYFYTPVWQPRRSMVVVC